MKKKFFLACSLVLLFSSLLFGCETLAGVNDLPEEAGKYIKTHFPDEKILKIKIEKDFLIVTYEVTLNSGTELEFDSEGNIKSIDSNFALPDSVIPSKIAEYVKNNYSGFHIVEWTLKINSQEVELNNGIELIFDIDGNFARIDM